MDEAPGRRQRWLALGLAGLGSVVLVWALWGLLRVAISESAPGGTAGGATTAAELCSRSVPGELAEACVAATQQRSAAASRPRELVAVLGVVLIGLAIGVGRASQRDRKKSRRNG